MARQTTAKQAFIYVEIDNSEGSPRKGQPLYTIHYRGNSGTGCKIMQSPDERFFKQEIKELRKRQKLTLLSRLPPGIKSIEGTMERKPYI